VVLAEKELTPSGAPPALALPPKGGAGAKKGGDKAAGGKKEKAAPAAKKEEAPKSGEDLEEQLAKEEKKKAAEHPLKVMDRDAPSAFVMDTWKKTYSNATSYDEAMADFWNTFDS